MLSTEGAYAVSLQLDGIEVFKPSDDGKQSHGGSAVLIPYAGRIRRGRYTFEGKTYQFALNSGENSIHGFAKDRLWRLLEVRADSVAFGAQLEDTGYPGVLDARLTYAIGPRSFSTRCRVRNIGHLAAPFVAGFHPYFLAKEWRLSAGGSVYRYELADKFFPTGRREKFDLTSVGPTTSLDDEFRAGGEIRLETDEYKLVMKRRNMPYLVVFNGKYAEGISVAVEPYSGLSDAFNNKIGLKVVDPGESFSCGYDISLVD